MSLKRKWPIIVMEATRFTRTRSTLDDFFRHDGKLYTVEGFGADDAEMRARIEKAQLDGDIRSKATREGQERYVAKGGRLGSPDLAKARTASAEARTKLKHIRLKEFRNLNSRALAAGYVTPREIAEYLAEKGLETPWGRKWTAANVRHWTKDLEIDDVAIETSGMSIVPESMPEQLKLISPADLDDKNQRLVIGVETSDASPGEPERVRFTEDELDAVRKFLAKHALDEESAAKRSANAEKLLPVGVRDWLVRAAREEKFLV